MIFVVLLLAIAIIWKYRYKNWLNPATLMAFIWSFVLFIYNLNLLPLNEISKSTYYIIVIGVIFFSFGSYFGYKTRFVVGRHQDYQDNCSFTLRYKAIIILEVVTLVNYLPDAINSLRLISSGITFSYLRANQGTVVTNPIILLIRNYVALPFTILIYPLASWCLLTANRSANKENRIKLLIFFLSVFIALSNMVTNGGRSALVYLVMHILCISILLGKHINLSSKTKRIILGSIILLFVIYYFITISRGITEVGESNITYICGCVPLLDLKLMKATEYTYGGTFFYGIFNFLFTVLGNIGVSTPQFFKDITQAIYVENIETVGDGIYMNAFVSWFFYLFMDGGYIALCIESIIYGWFSGAFFKRVIMNPGNLKKILAYAIVAHTILFSFIRFQFIQYYYFLAIAYIPLFVKSEIPMEEQA